MKQSANLSKSATAQSDRKGYLWLKRSSVLILILIIMYGAARLIDVSLGSYYTGLRAPYLQLLSESGVVIHWQTVQDQKGIVRYGTDLRNLKLSAEESSSGTIHRVKLSGLNSNTRYYYSVGSADNVFRGGTKNDWFVTSPPIGQSNAIRMWVLGDPGNWSDNALDVRDAMMKWLNVNKRESRTYLDLLLTTGDNAYTSGTNKQFQQALFTPYSDILRNISIWPAYGNHDDRRWAFFKIFDLPTQAEVGGLASGSERYYSFDYANTHIVFLDTQSSDLTKNGEMINWLRHDLLNTRQQWLIAVFHHPAYSKGTHDSDSNRDSWGRLTKVRENLLPVLERYGVDLVLNGHSHMYQRSYLLTCHYGNSESFLPSMVLDSGLGDPAVDGAYLKYSKKMSPHEGTVYIVLGSSSKLDQGRLDHPAHAVNLLELGSMVIDIKGNRLDAKFINDKMQIMDTFSLIKGSSAAKKTTGKCQ